MGAKRSRRIWRAATRRPHAASISTSCRSLATLFATVGALALISVVLSPGMGAVPQRLALGVLSLGLSVVVARVGHRLPGWVFWVFYVQLNLSVTACVAFASSWSAALACGILFVLLLTESFFVLSWLEAGIEFCLGAASLIGSLSYHGRVDRGSMVLLLGVIAANCLITGWLVRAGDRADLDSLTGVLGRRGAQPAAEAVLLRADRDRTLVALALIDMDYFKHVNDTLGHAAGDALLVAVSDAARAVVPLGATFGRWGGDEFLLVLPRSDGAAACAVVDALRARIPTGQTISVGIAERARGEDLASLLSRADHVLYDVKRTRRGSTAVVGTRSAPETLLRDAAFGLVAVHYQPVVELATSGVVAAVASASGLPPEAGSARAGREQVAGLSLLGGGLAELSALLARGALDVAAGWPAVSRAVFTDAPGPVRLVMRLGAGQDAATLPQAALAVLDALRESGADPDRLVLSIPERLLDSASDRIREAVAPLRALGARVVITEVGTGSLSLARLSAAPIDGLWLTSGLLPGVGDELGHDREGKDGKDSKDRRAAGTVAALTQLFRGRGLLVGIGGVATPEQAAWAVAQGCTHAWGPMWPQVANIGTGTGTGVGNGVAVGQVPASAGGSSSHEWLDSQPSMRSDAGS